MRTKTSATPKGDPLTLWIVSGSPVEKMLEMKEPRSEERNWIVRRRIIGRRRSPTGLKSSEMASVMASPWSPTRSGTASIMATTTASRTPWGAPACLSSIIFVVVVVVVVAVELGLEGLGVLVFCVCCVFFFSSFYVVFVLVFKKSKWERCILVLK